MPEAAKDIAELILTAPKGREISVIHDLLDEQIKQHSRDERGEPDQRVVSMWLEELSMRVTVYHLAKVRVSQTSYGRRDFNHGRAESARGALTAIVAFLLTEL